MSPARVALIEERIRVEADGGVVAFSGKVDFGQGIRTAFAQIVADELDVPLDRVRMILGETALTPWDAGTWGSGSIRTDGLSLRRAAAAARRELIGRAARSWSVDPATLRTADAAVRRSDGARLTYAELTRDEPLRGPVPEDVPLKSADELRLVGSATPRLESREIVTGRATYVADVRLPGMARGAVLRPPARGARLRELDDRAARALPGIVAIVREDSFVGVVAERHAEAVAGVAALVADWEVGERATGSSDNTIRAEGDIDAALGAAAQLVEATYTLAHISNAPIGPSSAVADVREDGATIYTATQTPFGTRAQIAAVLGLPEDRVAVVPRRSSGTYGRNGNDDAPLEAARLSRAAKRPVLVQWSREEEFAWGSNRPEAVLEATAGLDGAGRIVAWRYNVQTNVHTPEGAVKNVEQQLVTFMAAEGAVPAYDIPAVRVDLHVEVGAIRTASFRAIAGAENVFGIESFVDELAERAGVDPIAYRIAHLSDARMRRLLAIVAERSGWPGTEGSGGGRGLGCACGSLGGTRAAQVVEVAVDGRGQVRVERMWCAVDPGLVINPDGVRNQIEGAMQQAASLALLEEQRHRDGRIAASSWDSYPIATFRDAPRSIEVTVAGDATQPSTGVGEVGTVPLAAALANAVHAACGARVRDLPMTPARVRAATPVSR